MNRICYVRVYGDLRYLLHKKYRDGEITIKFLLSASVKDIIESLGIPHTEVGLVLLNGISADWNEKISDGSRLAVYPFFYNVDIKTISRVYWQPERIRFVSDVHLGRLSKYLRILGFDCVYQNNFEDEEIIEIAHREKRIILTKDRGILKNNRVKYGLLLRSKNTKEQLKEVMERFDLEAKKKPFTRCINCNQKLKKISRKEAMGVFSYLSDRYYTDFYRCSLCKKVYYKGSHYYRMLKEIF
ncbi:MAG: Mut7-C RNAse domain-containing protein [Brevinematia bacterium]